MIMLYTQKLVLYMSHISVKENKCLLNKYMGTLYKLSSIKKQEMQKKFFHKTDLRPRWLPLISTKHLR